MTSWLNKLSQAKLRGTYLPARRSLLKAGMVNESGAPVSVNCQVRTCCGQEHAYVHVRLMPENEHMPLVRSDLCPIRQ